MVPREVKKEGKVFVFILLIIMANVRLRLKGDERKVFTVQLY